MPSDRRENTDAFHERKVDSLSKEAISRVLAAEAQANEIRAKAEAEARARVEAAEISCAERKNAELEQTADELDARLDTVRERAYSLQTWKSLLNEAGFDLLAVYDERRFTEPADDAQRWVLVAKNHAINQKND